MIRMLDFFKSVMNFFQMIGDLIVNIVSGIFAFFQMIPQAFGVVTYSLAYIPSALVVFVSAGIGLCIILHILGR